MKAKKKGRIRKSTGRKYKQPFHVEAFTRYVMGASDRENAKESGVCQATIMNWRRKEDWEEQLKSFKVALRNQAIKTTSKRAEKIIEMMMSTQEMSFEIARESLKAFYNQDMTLKPISPKSAGTAVSTVKTAMDVLNNITKNIRALSGMTPQEPEEILRAIMTDPGYSTEERMRALKMLTELLGLNAPDKLHIKTDLTWAEYVTEQRRKRGLDG